MHGRGLLVSLALTAASLPAASSAQGPEDTCYIWTGVEQIVALGDLHGSYRPFTALLRGMELIDENLDWSGGRTHLVLDGDLLDRGSGERPLLDLVRRLESQAMKTGGGVHVVLGNHEVMNLVHDFRYVSREGYAAFADFELTEDRERALKIFAGRVEGDEPAIRAAFDERYPPGYFGRVRAFAADGPYGRWLLDKPLAIKIDGNLFVHGGLTEDVARLGLEGINHRAHEELRTYLEQAARLRKAGILSVLDSFREEREGAHRFIATARRAPPEQFPPELVQAAIALLEVGEGLPFSPSGPVWYRGNALENELLERSRLKFCLSALSARRLFLGHTPTHNGRITTRFGGRLVRLDVGTVYGKPIEALEIRGDQLEVFDLVAGKRAPPMAEPVQGEGTPPGLEEMTDAAAEEFLRHAEITSLRPLGRGRTHPMLVEMKDNGIRLRGIFKSGSEPPGQSGSPPGPNLPRERFEHEIAAYRLSRLLGLRLVPPTVRRTIGSTPGSLQLWIERAVDQQASETYGLSPKDPARFDFSRCRGKLFDALIGLEERDPNDRLRLLDQSRLLLVDNGAAFGAGAGLPPDLFAGGCRLDAELQGALEGLNRRVLRGQLGSLLSSAQRRALLRRRDRILSLWKAHSTPAQTYSFRGREGPGASRRARIVVERKVRSTSAIAWSRRR